MTQTINRDTLVTDARRVLDDVEALLEQALTATGHQAQELRQRAAEALKNAQGRLRDAQDVVTESAKVAARATDGWVHEHPWGAIGIGTGIGFLVGLLVARR